MYRDKDLPLARIELAKLSTGDLMDTYSALETLCEKIGECTSLEKGEDISCRLVAINEILEDRRVPRWTYSKKKDVFQSVEPIARHMIKY